MTGPMQNSRSPRRSNRRRERGAVIVELALVAVPLTTLVLGMVELGLMWKADTRVAAASRQGARVASHLGDDPLTDQAALRAVVAAMGGTQEVEYVIIYDAQDPDLGRTCTGAANQRCNRYDAADLALIDDSTRWGCGAGDLDANWCPTTDRETDIDSRDTLGVAVGHQHQTVTIFFGGGSRQLTGSTVMALEPND